MLRRRSPLGAALPLLLVGCAMLISAGEAAAERRSSPDLFYNYYAQPGYNGLGAEMYPSPRPAPPLVGHTYVTYQPLMPHEFLHVHHRNYVRRHADGSCTRTSVTWGNRLMNQRPLTLAPRPGRGNVAGLYWERFSPWNLR
jgi:hypothetical protein